MPNLIPTKPCISVIERIQGQVKALAFSADNRHIAILHASNVVTIDEVETGEHVVKIEHPHPDETECLCIAWHHKDNTLYIGNDYGEIHAVSLHNTKGRLINVNDIMAPITSIVSHENGIYAMEQTGDISLIDPETQEAQNVHETGFHGSVQAKFLTVSEDGSVMTFSVSNTAYEHRLSKPRRRLSNAFLGPAHTSTYKDESETVYAGASLGFLGATAPERKAYHRFDRTHHQNISGEFLDSDIAAITSEDKEVGRVYFILCPTFDHESGNKIPFTKLELHGTRKGGIPLAISKDKQFIAVGRGLAESERWPVTDDANHIVILNFGAPMLGTDRGPKTTPLETLFKC